VQDPSFSWAAELSNNGRRLFGGAAYLPAITLVTPLPFALELKDGERLTVVGDAIACFMHLSQTQQEAHYWRRAIRMFDTAAQEPTYLRTATICLQTALLMEFLLAEPPAP
jgi:hypothetical protein